MTYRPWLGAVGGIMNIQHLEPVGWYHFAHSYVRCVRASGHWLPGKSLPSTRALAVATHTSPEVLLTVPPLLTVSPCTVHGITAHRSVDQGQLAARRRVLVLPDGESLPRRGPYHLHDGRREVHPGPINLQLLQPYLTRVVVAVH